MNTDNPRTFVMPARDVKLVAVFEPKEIEPMPELFILTVEGGTGSGRFEQGSIIEVSATVPEGMKFIRWSDGEVASTRSFVMPAYDVVLSAEFEVVTIQTFSLTVAGGSGSGQFEQGAEVTIEADEPPSGMKFKRWSDGDYSNPRTLTMPPYDITIVAEWVEIEVPLFVLTVINGMGATTTQQLEAEEQIGLHYGGVPAGQRFLNWTLDDAVLSADGWFLFTMPARDATVRVVSEPMPVEPAGEIWYVFIRDAWNSELTSSQPTGTATFEIDSGNRVAIHCDWDNSVIGEGNVPPNTTTRIPIGSSYLERVPDGLNLESSRWMNTDVHALGWGRISKATLVIRRGNDSLIRNGDMWFEIER